VQKLSTALKKALKTSGIDRAVRQSEALLIWESVVGEAVAKNCSAEEINHKTIIVKASTPVWRNELSLKKMEIIKKLNKKLGEELLKDMQVI
tara:strand:+ start:45432 stop:45707 length:276 start_codon:yes stop_codon:yes gene_type:complete